MAYLLELQLWTGVFQEAQAADWTGRVKHSNEQDKEA